MSRELELSVAALEGDIERVKVILAEGNLDNDHPDMVALYNAAAQGHIQIVELLINHGMQINKKISNITDGFFEHSFGSDLYELTPLTIACMNNHLEIVRLLINKGANINNNDLVGIVNHALYAACSRGNHEIINLLLAQPEIYYDAAQLLLAAAKNSRLDTLAFLLNEKGFDINSRVDIPVRYRGSVKFDDYTVLGMACEDGAIDVIDFLLAQEAIDVTQVFDQERWTPLEKACIAGSLNAVDRLLANHSDKFIDTIRPSKDPIFQVNILTRAFLCACLTGNLDIINRFLVFGADVNTLLVGSNNILTIMIQQNKDVSTEAAKHLIENTSINLHHVNDDGKTAMQLATDFENIIIIKSLIARGIEESLETTATSSSSSSSSYNPGFFQPSPDYLSSDEEEYYDYDSEIEDSEPDIKRPK